MKKTTLIEQIMAGSPILVCEFRSALGETINYRDKTTQKPAIMKLAKLNCEAGAMVLAVQVRCEDSEDPVVIAESYNRRFKKGDKIALHLQTLERNKGAYTATGTVEAIEA